MFDILNFLIVEKKADCSVKRGTNIEEAFSLKLFLNLKYYFSKFLLSPPPFPNNYLKASEI